MTHPQPPNMTHILTILFTYPTFQIEGTCPPRFPGDLLRDSSDITLRNCFVILQRPKRISPRFPQRSFKDYAEVSQEIREWMGKRFCRNYSEESAKASSDNASEIPPKFLIGFLIEDLRRSQDLPEDHTMMPQF